MEVYLTILGNSSASPTIDRNQSGQLLKMGSTHILIDCGEGTQSRLMKYKQSYHKIDIILISHLHGDHYLGLFGLLNTMSLNGRTRPLNLFAPKGLREVIKMHFSLSNTTLTYELNIKEIGEDELLYSTNRLEIKAYVVEHRIPCFSFLIQELNVQRKLNVDECQKLNIGQQYYNSIKEGQDVVLQDGIIIPNEQLSFDPEPPFSYGYITDTIYLERLIPNFYGVQVLYHEATFLDNLIDRAKIAFHSTAEQAGQFANKALVSQLLIGHFSSRYRDLSDHLNEAQKIFTRTELALEGQTFQFK